MAIDYKASSDLMRDPEFIGRTQIACLTYAAYISDEDNSVPAHTTRLKWSQATFDNSEAAVNLIMPVLIMDDKVKTSGAAITDAALQTAVETTVNRNNVRDRSCPRPPKTISRGQHGREQRHRRQRHQLGRGPAARERQQQFAQ